MRYYLDHNASTPVDDRVLQRFTEVERSCPANPGSLHGAGRRAHAALEHARAEVAEALQLEPDQVLFVSGGTEANNMVVGGLGALDRPVLLAPVEHPSVLAAAEIRGTEWWRVTADGRAVVEPPAGPVGLLCLVHAQNEIGTLQPIDEAAALARDLGVPLHADASQSLGRVPVAAVLAAADAVTISTHKLGGLRGCTVLGLRNPGALRPLLRGGAQEHGLRAGTPSPALAAATARAVRLAVEEQGDRAAVMQRLREEFEREFAERVACRRVTPSHAVPNTVMYQFAVRDGRELLPALDLAGVEASQGSACSSGAPTPPRVLAAIGFDDDTARRCVRFSFDWRGGIADAAAAGAQVRAVVSRLVTARASSV